MNMNMLNTNIVRLEEEMKQLPQANLPVEHFFSNCLYGRKLPMPEGTLVVGKTHRYPHLLIILSGRVRVVSNKIVNELKAGDIIESPGMTKRAIYAEEDSVLLTTHYTKETDLLAIEEDLIVGDQ